MGTPFLSVPSQVTTLLDPSIYTTIRWWHVELRTFPKIHKKDLVEPHCNNGNAVPKRSPSNNNVIGPYSIYMLYITLPVDDTPNPYSIRPFSPEALQSHSGVHFQTRLIHAQRYKLSTQLKLIRACNYQRSALKVRSACHVTFLCHPGLARDLLTCIISQKNISRLEFTAPQVVGERTVFGGDDRICK